jgi:hypothetical protein
MALSLTPLLVALRKWLTTHPKIAEPASFNVFGAGHDDLKARKCFLKVQVV